MLSADDPGDALARGQRAFGEFFPQALAYTDLLSAQATEWGLLGPRESARVWDRHLLNSVALASRIDPQLTVADVGSGAGLPGLPIAIARPDLRVSLIESLERRVKFLRLAVQELGFEGRVVVIHRRAEQLHQKFDVVVSRAVAPLPKLLPWCAQLTRAGGEILAMRGSNIDAELSDYLLRHPTMTGRIVASEIAAPWLIEPAKIITVIEAD